MKLFSIAKFFLPLAFVVTILCGLVYLSVQQNYRMSANDPQIQIAEDAVIRLNNGIKPEGIVGTEKVDLARSLAFFVIVYDTSGKPTASSAILNGRVPQLPDGVLQQTHQLGESRFTWQPAVGVREATVVVPFDNGYVLVGRSLREIEQRERMLGVYLRLAWVSAIVGSLVLISFFTVLEPKGKK